MRGLCAAVVAGLAGLASAAEPIPVKDFVRWGEYDDAKISPNGDYVGVTKWLGDSLGVAFIDLKTHQLAGAMKLARGDSPALFEWVSPNRVVIPIATQYGSLDQLYATGELIGINADGSNRKYLFGYRGANNGNSSAYGAGSKLDKKAEYADAWLVDPMPWDPDHAAVSVFNWDLASDRTQPFVDLLDVQSGNHRRLGMVPAYDADMLVDTDGQPRFGSGLDDQALRKIVALAKGTRNWKTLPQKQHEVNLLALSMDGAAAYFETSDHGEPFCLQEYVFAKDEVHSLLCDANSEFDTILSGARRPIAVRREAGKPQTTFIDTANDPDTRVQKSLEHSFPGMRVTITSRTLDGSRAIVLVDSDRSPGDYFLYDRVAKRVDQVLSRRSWIDPAAMQPMEPFEFKARDGLLLHGYVTAPNGLAARRMPLVVVPHGGPHGVRDSWGWDAEAQLLASRGYAVLQVNYRGSGGFGWDFRTAGYRKWGTAMQDDLTDAVKWSIAQGIADPARICIYGGSYGGYAALMSATREPDLYKCAAGLAGAYDLRLLRSGSDIAKSWSGAKYLADALGSDATELADQSPVTQVAKLKAKLLIAHGTADRRVSFDHAKALRAALDQANKPYEWMEFEGEEHGFWKDEDAERFYTKLLEFLDKNIGKPAAAGG